MAKKEKIAEKERESLEKQRERDRRRLEKLEEEMRAKQEEEVGIAADEEPREDLGEVEDLSVMPMLTALKDGDASAENAEEAVKTAPSGEETSGDTEAEEKTEEENVVTVEDVSDGDTAEDKASDGIDAAESAGTPEGDATAEDGKETNADGAVGNKPADVD